MNDALIVSSGRFVLLIENLILDEYSPLLIYLYARCRCDIALSHAFMLFSHVGVHDFGRSQISEGSICAPIGGS
jgi:hypothetical protein